MKACPDCHRPIAGLRRRAHRSPNHGERRWIVVHATADVPDCRVTRAQLDNLFLVVGNDGAYPAPVRRAS